MSHPSFIVPAGHLRGTYDAVLISTDVEPDDILALKVLAPRLAGVPMLFIVGEGPCDKRQMAEEMLLMFGLSESASVVQGARSDNSYPMEALNLYRRGEPSPAVTDDGNGGDGGGMDRAAEAAAAAAATAAFLERHEAPFALLLKPPHELLGADAALLRKTRAALYGSFNLSELRVRMEAAHPAMGAAGSCEATAALMNGFGALLWVERSSSVGRDCCIDPISCPEAWPAIRADRPLSSLIALWNDTIVQSMSSSRVVAGMSAAVREALATRGAGGGEGAARGAYYAKLEDMCLKAEKKVAVMLQIARSGGEQMCHADTLVATVLLDRSGGLCRREVRCKVAADERARLKVEPEEGGSVAALLAEGSEREALAKESLQLLGEALAG